MQKRIALALFLTSTSCLSLACSRRDDHGADLRDPDPPHVTAPKPATTPAAAAPASHPSAAPSVKGPSCADVHPNVGQFPGLLPLGVPASLASHLVYISRRNNSVFPPTPIVVDGEVLFIEHTIDHGEMAITRAAGDKREPFRTIRIPNQGSSQFSSYQFDAAVGEHNIGVVAIAGKEAFLLLVDKKTWALRKNVPLKLDEPASLYGLEHPHIAFGGGVFGMAVQGSMSGARWDLAWTTAGEDGRPHGKPLYLKSATHVKPWVAWNGASFAVLSARDRKASGLSLGIYVMPDKPDASPTFVSWLDPEKVPSYQQSSFQQGGSLIFQEGAYHVAIEVSPHGESERVTQVVHAPPGGAARVETCKPEKKR
ncbi:Hypothetical protein A7982_11507 [Minicystis rosea]|nr:Hypothetical protein A7982_11507 [Minicystis rosea]